LILAGVGLNFGDAFKALPVPMLENKHPPSFGISMIFTLLLAITVWSPPLTFEKK
jgi:hypothetical protein